MRAPAILSSGLSLVCLLVWVESPRAGSITSLDSSVSLTAAAQAGAGSIVVNSNSQDQGATINPLAILLTAQATYEPDQSVLATAGASATWTSASQGQVIFTNVGWNTTDATGSADLSGGMGWTYTFTSNVTGNFVVNYDVTASGTATTSAPFFGLNGFFIYAGNVASNGADVFTTTGLNSTGTAVLALEAGDTYWVRIDDAANIHGVLGTADQYMNGTFDFSVQPASLQVGAQSAPEPASLLMLLLGAAAIGVPAILRRVPRYSAGETETPA